MAKPKQELYQYSAILHDSDKGDKVIVEPTTVLANDRNHAERVAVRAIPAEYDDKLVDVEVVVRPF